MTSTHLKFKRIIAGYTLELFRNSPVWNCFHRGESKSFMRCFCIISSLYWFCKLKYWKTRGFWNFWIVANKSDRLTVQFDPINVLRSGIFSQNRGSVGCFVSKILLFYLFKYYAVFINCMIKILAFYFYKNPCNYQTSVI